MYVHLCTYDVHKNDSWKRWLTGGPDVVVVAAVSLATYIIAIVYYYILHAVGRAQLYGGTAAWRQPWSHPWLRGWPIQQLHCYKGPGILLHRQAGLMSSNKKRPMVTILALAVVSAMALAVASAMVSAMTTAVASALRLPLLAMSLLSGRSGNNKNYGSRSAPTAMPHYYILAFYYKIVSKGCFSFHFSSKTFLSPNEETNIPPTFNFFQLKVSRSRNKIVEPKLLPKNEPTNLFFYPDYCSG